MDIREHDYQIVAPRATLPSGKLSGWEVSISPATSYGYFEHDDIGEGGGLWFEGRTLVDYDGRFELPRGVALAIQAVGYDLGDCVPDCLRVEAPGQ